MSDTERDILVTYGRRWYAEVKHGRVERDEDLLPTSSGLLAEVNDCLRQWHSPVRVTRGYKAYEMFVRCRGVSGGDYLSLAGELASTSFARENPARSILQWSQGPTPLSRLTPHCATVAVIIYFAEVARGFSHEVASFEAWLRETVQMQTPRQAFSSWRQFPSRFAFALTALQDQRGPAYGE